MPEAWWRRAVIYEVYPRSFADGNGDGDGDLEGLLQRLPYLAELGVDGLWIAPWYPSPMADGGYDVSDFTGIHPRFGDLRDADAVIAAAHALGLRVITDLVANHTSTEHPWFRAALAAGPGSPERARYLFRDGRGPGGAAPPNNWISAFGGSAWSRVEEPDGTPGQWYLHLFAEEQADLNWSDPAVQQDFDAILRFWFDRGVDGLRIDAAPALAKAPDFRDADYGGDPRFVTIRWVDNPHWDVDAVHEVVRRFRRIADEYEDRILVAEAVVSSAERLAAYLGPEEMQTAFDFAYLKCAWDAAALRRVIDASLAQSVPIGVPPTWVTSSHDEVRLRTRFGRRTTSAAHFADGQGEPVDLELGLRRSRASALLTLALPGTAYLYQGEELGLPEVEDLPDEVITDPVFRRTGGEFRGRDGCRVPIPWSGDAPPYGFAPDGARAWLPQPEGWGGMTVETGRRDPGSMLRLVQRALMVRRERLAVDDFRWVGARPGVLEFDRGPGFTCVVNLSGAPVPIDGAREVLVASAGPTDGMLPDDAAMWLGR
ncbi:glycoside hydrolase family 13 protein [Amnibacterium sp.]|uniref:glycoside hydrolase family 13 protein n=1 Tax=Amnibacterium sp. TaxID=1872496 RepID=UPI003F7C49BE